MKSCDTTRVDYAPNVREQQQQPVPRLPLFNGQSSARGVLIAVGIPSPKVLGVFAMMCVSVS